MTYKIVIDINSDILLSVGLVEEKSKDIINNGKWIAFIDVEDPDQFQKIFVPGRSLNELFDEEFNKRLLKLSPEAQQILDTV